MDGITLPPDLEQFVAEAVSSGQFADVDQVVRTSLELLRHRQQARAEFLASVLAAQEEADRVGCVSGDEMLSRAKARIAERFGTAH